MPRRATRAELVTALLEMHELLFQIKILLSHLIREEQDANTQKYIKQNVAAARPAHATTHRGTHAQPK